MSGAAGWVWSEKMKEYDNKEIDYVRRKENIIQRNAGDR